MSGNRERTFIAVKPDGVQRGIVNNIMKQFEQRGYKLVAIKMVQASRQHLEVIIILFMLTTYLFKGTLPRPEE